jgi:hypothetical protein
MRKLTTFSVFFIVCSCLTAGHLSAGFDKDPLKETQSNTVPVTEELLTREGQPAPASPTYPLVDTSGFLVKMPYGKAEEYRANDEAESSDHFWNRWFFWKKDQKQREITEPIENE